MADVRPDAGLIVAMTAVCEGCPVRARCAVEALAAGPTGGFYAGVWTPWLAGGEDARGMRAYAKRQLKDVAGIPRVGRPRGARQPYTP